MTTTVLGANGKLGGMLAHFARTNGLDWLTQSRDGTEDVCWSGAFDDPAVDLLLRPGGTVINMIGDTGANPETLQEINVDFVRTLMSEASKRKVAHVILASSAAVYGSGAGLLETQELNPAKTSRYAMSKIAMEDAARGFSKTNGGTKFTVLRIGNVAGADGLLAAAERHVAEGTPLQMDQFDDATSPIRSYITPQELFTAVNALSKPPTERFRIVNVAHPDPISLSDLIEAYRSNLMPDLVWNWCPASANALRNVTLNVDTLGQYMSFSAMTAGSLALSVKAYRGDVL